MASTRRVAFQGERGAYSEMATLELLGNDTESLPRRSFDDVFASVEAGDSDFGLVPIENSLAGSIHRNYDLLLRHSLFIIAETKLRIEHCLIANPGVKLADVQIVRSHPQALAQCEAQLASMGLPVEAAYDTAGSVRDLRDNKSRDSAALASRLAAEVYGMTILKESMEDDSQNYTRFLLLGREPVNPPGDCKTSIVFTVENVPGVLFKAMACFALRDVDLAKIESRPIPGLSWEYRFYLDFIGSQHQEPGSLALAQLAEMTRELRVLGTYPTAQTSE